MLGIAGLPSILQFFAMLYLPESPKWLIKTNQNSKALDVMKKIFHERTAEAKEEIQHEFNHIIDSISKEGGGVIKLRDTYVQLFTIYRRSLFVGVMLQVWQQLAGINTAMYYGPFIMKQAGMGGDTDRQTLIRSIPLGAINFLGTIVAVFYTDK